MQITGGTRRTWALYVLVLAVVGTAVFAGALSLPFIGDDYHEIARALDDPAGWFSAGDGSFLRPLLWATLRVDHALGGLDPAGYHAVNVGLHVVNAALVAAMVAAVRAAAPPSRRHQGRSRPPGDHVLPMAAGAVFLVLPVHGEPVHWVAARADLLATALALVALAAFARARTPGVTRPRAWQVGSVVAVALALAGKESAATVPLVVTLLALVVDRDGGPPTVRAARALRASTPHHLVLAVYLAHRWWQFGSPIGGYGSDSYLASGPVRLVANLVTVLVRAVVPLPGARWDAVVVGAVAALAVGGVVAGTRRGWFVRSPGRRLRWPWPTAAVAAMVVTSLPILGVGVGRTTGGRVVYLPSVFAAVLVAAAAVATARRWPRAGPVGVGLLIVVALVANAHETARWATAGRAVDTVTAALIDRDPTEDVYLVNVPDTVGGIVAFRNSAAGYERVHRRAGDGRILIVTMADLEGPDDVFSAEVRPSGSRGGPTIALGSADADVSRSTDRGDDGPWEVRALRPGSYEVVFDPAVRPDQVLVYADGAVRSLEDL